MNLVAINSLSHSGSTVLSMALASHPALVSMGEIYQVIREAPDVWLSDTETLCSCGQPAAKCNVWGPALQDIKSRNTPKENTLERYISVIQSFEQHYGQDFTLVDTSKGHKHLPSIAHSDAFALKVIFLLRDVRTYAYSQRKVVQRQQRKGVKKLKGSLTYQFLRWFSGNRRFQKFFADNGLDIFQLGYEDMCFNQEQRLSELCNFLDIEFSNAMTELTSSEHHILMGNPMRLQKDKQQGIKYDAKWLQRTEHLAPAFLLSFVMQYNAKQVYKEK